MVSLRCVSGCGLRDEWIDVSSRQGKAQGWEGKGKEKETGKEGQQGKTKTEKATNLSN